MSKVIFETYRKCAAKAIENLKQYTDEVLVAGGFPRDYILSTKYNIKARPNDIDVYVRYNKDMDDHLRDKMEEVTSRYKNGLNGIKKVYKKHVNYPQDGLFSRHMNIEIQVIMLETGDRLEDYINTNFDLSICKATFDGVDFKELPEFTETIKTKKITLNDNIGINELQWAFRSHVAKVTCRFARVFKLEGYNHKFAGSPYKCKLIGRTELTDLMINDKNWLYRTNKYYYYDKEAGSY